LSLGHLAWLRLLGFFDKRSSRDGKVAFIWGFSSFACFVMVIRGVFCGGMLVKRGELTAGFLL
jgi:hypothetical protein